MNNTYRTRPFLAGQWGGIHGYNVPVSELPRLYEAFAILTKHVIRLRVRGPVHSALTGGPLVLHTLTVAEVLPHGFVEVQNFQASDGTMEWQSIYPDDGTWQEIELRTVEKELDKQKEGTQCTTCSSY